MLLFQKKFKIQKKEKNIINGQKNQKWKGRKWGIEKFRLLRDQTVEGKKEKVFAYKMLKESHIREGRPEKKYKIKKRKKTFFHIFSPRTKSLGPIITMQPPQIKKPTSIFNPLLVTHSPTNQTNWQSCCHLLSLSTPTRPPGLTLSPLIISVESKSNSFFLFISSHKHNLFSPQSLVFTHLISSIEPLPKQPLISPPPMLEVFYMGRVHIGAPTRFTYIGR